MEYPKINSLFKRRLDGDRSLIFGDYSLPEFEVIKRWQVFEKIDGTNVRIVFERGDPEVIMDEPLVRFLGRTKDAQLPPHLLRHLQETFTLEKMQKVFPTASRIIIYGEGYGPKIQSGGNYRDDVSFICFDVLCEGWWLKYEDRREICDSLGIDHVPYLGAMSEAEIVDYVRSRPLSTIADSKKYVMEGVVCATEHLIKTRKGDILKFKLRCEDMPATA